jgi:hypothetical protein
MIDDLHCHRELLRNCQKRSTKVSGQIARRIVEWMRL